VSHGFLPVLALADQRCKPIAKSNTLKLRRLANVTHCENSEISEYRGFALAQRPGLTEWPQRRWDFFAGFPHVVALWVVHSVAQVAAVPAGSLGHLTKHQPHSLQFGNFRIVEDIGPA
jgi:hypothetical protein